MALSVLESLGGLPDQSGRTGRDTKRYRGRLLMHVLQEFDIDHYGPPRPKRRGDGAQGHGDCHCIP